MEFVERRRYKISATTGDRQLLIRAFTSDLLLECDAAGRVETAVLCAIHPAPFSLIYPSSLAQIFDFGKVFAVTSIPYTQALGTLF